MKKTLIFCLVNVLMVISMKGYGQDFNRSPSDMSDFPSEKKEKEIQHKKISLFSPKPSRDTASEQMEYASLLEKKGKIRKAIRAYDALVRKWHSLPQAPIAQFKMAKLLEERGKYVAAFDEYQYLIKYFTAGFPYEEVIERQYRIANYIMTRHHWDILGMPGYTTPEDSLPLWEKILKNAPSYAKAPEIMYTIASIYEKNGDYEEALTFYMRLRNEYSTSDFVPEADCGRVRCLYEIARSRPRDEEACRDALSALTMFIRDYPDHPVIKEMKEKQEEMRGKLEEMYYQRAVFYEKGSHRKPEAAIVAYKEFVRRFPSSELSIKAQERIEELEKQIKETNEK